MKVLTLYLSFLVVLTGAPVLAQAQDPSNASPNNSPAPAAKTTSTGTADKKTSDPKKPKKVWTNDEMGSLKGSVSVVGDKRASRRQTAESPC